MSSIINGSKRITKDIADLNNIEIKMDIHGSFNPIASELQIHLENKQNSPGQSVKTTKLN